MPTSIWPPPPPLPPPPLALLAVAVEADTAGVTSVILAVTVPESLAVLDSFEDVTANETVEVPVEVAANSISISRVSPGASEPMGQVRDPEA